MLQLLNVKHSPRTAYAGLALITIALLLVPVALQQHGNSWVRILDLALLYTMLALGLNIVVGFAGLLDLGYIAFFAVGAYLYALLASPHLAENFEWIQAMFPNGLHLSVWLSIVLGAAVAAFFGALLGAPTLKLRGDYLAIVTLGFGEIIRIFLNNLNAPINLTNGPQGITNIDPIRIAGVSLAGPPGSRGYLDVFGYQMHSVNAYYYLFLALTVITIWLCIRLQESRVGRAWVAIREDEIAAKAMGINTRNMKLLAFAMGASFGGVSGGMFAAFQGFISPESFVLHESIVVLAMVVLGGMGHIPGVVLGGLILASIPELLRHFVVPVQQFLFGHLDTALAALSAAWPGRFSQWLHETLIPEDHTLMDAEVARMLIYGLALVLVMRYRPKGIWPAPQHGEMLPSRNAVTPAKA